MSDDYWDDYSEYDQAAETLKDALRSSIRDEVKNRIETLGNENRELQDRLKNLDALELAAKRAQAKAEREYANARREAERDVRKLKLTELLSAIDERLYTVAREYVKREKCDRCDDRRMLNYKTPLGKDAKESCECAAQDSHWAVTEVVAHEVYRRDGQLKLWWIPISRWSDDSESFSLTMLKNSEGVDFKEVVKYPTQYSFKDAESAQRVADVMNEASNA